MSIECISVFTCPCPSTSQGHRNPDNKASRFTTSSCQKVTSIGTTTFGGHKRQVLDYTFNVRPLSRGTRMFERTQKAIVVMCARINDGSCTPTASLIVCLLSCTADILSLHRAPFYHTLLIPSPLDLCCWMKPKTQGLHIGNMSHRANSSDLQRRKMMGLTPDRTRHIDTAQMMSITPLNTVMYDKFGTQGR